MAADLGHSHPATNICLDCKDVVDFHSQDRPIEEQIPYQQANPNLGYLHPKSCIQHRKSFEFLNVDTKTQNALLCSECLAEDQTSLTRLEDGSSCLLHQKLEHIRELGSQGTAHLAELCEEEESLSSRLKGLEESRDRSLSEIRKVFDSLHDALKTRQLELEREVEELSKTAGFALNEERERSRVWQGQLSLLEKCVEEINSNTLLSNSTSLSSPFTRSQTPSQPILEESSTSSSSSSPSSLHVSEKALMVDACLLEDALRNSLSSSRASSSLTDVQSQLRVSKIRDQIELLKEELKLESLLHRISSIFSVTSTSSCSISRSDWSKNNVQSVMTFYSYGSGANQLSNPWGMTYSPDSKLFYVCDNDNNRIQVFRNHPQAGREGRVEIEFLSPLGSAESSSSGLALYPPYSAPPSLSHPRDICYHDGQLFIVDSCHHQVQVWRAEDGSFLRTIGTGYGKDVGRFNYPWGCTVYQNHLFVSDPGNDRIQKFSLSNFSVVKVIGSYGSGLGQLRNPRELSVFNDKLYVTEQGNLRISVFDPESGTALSVIGPSLPRDGSLSRPVGLLFSRNLCSSRPISIVSLSSIPITTICILLGLMVLGLDNFPIL